MYLSERDKKTANFSLEPKSPESESRYAPNGRSTRPAVSQSQDLVDQEQTLKASADEQIKNLEQEIAYQTKLKLEARTKELNENAEKEIKLLEAAMESQRQAAIQSQQRRSKELQDKQEKQLQDLTAQMAKETEARLLQRSQELKESGEAKLRQLEAQLAADLQAKMDTATLRHVGQLEAAAAAQRDAQIRQEAANAAAQRAAAAAAKASVAAAADQVERIGAMLSDVEGVMTALANPEVDSAVISLADLGIDELAAKGVIKPGQTVEIKQATAVITDPNDSTLNKVVKLADVGLDAAVAAGKLNPGDSLLIQKGTAIIQSALTPAPKQPVNVTPPAAAPATTTTSQRPVPHLPGCPQLASAPLRHTANDVQGEPALPLRGSKVMKQSGVSIPLFGAAVAADLASR